MGKVLFMRKGETHTVPGQILPAGYTELTYIQSSGTQYIDIGLACTANTVVELSLSLTSTDGDQKFFGVYSPGVAFGVYQSKWRLGSGWENNTINATLSKTTIKASGTTWSINNSNVSVSSGMGASPGTMVLCAIRYAGNVIDYASIIVYGLKIWHGDTLVRDFVPCINPSGAIGMYDLVERTFYGNAGTGVFIGSEVA